MDAFINKFYFTCVAQLEVQFVHVNFTYSTYLVYFVTMATATAYHRQTTISLTFLDFPDFSSTNVKFNVWLFHVVQVSGHPELSKNIQWNRSPTTYISGPIYKES